MSVARIALEYDGKLYNLKAIAPIVAKRLTESPIGIARDFLVLTAILRKRYGNLDAATKEALEYMLDGSDVINSIILKGIIKGLKQLGVKAREGSIKFEEEEDKKRFEEMLEEVYEIMLEVIRTVSNPRTKAEALQAYVSLTDDAKIRVQVDEVQMHGK